MSDAVIFVSDLHAPWTDLDKLNHFYEIVSEFKPRSVIALGDMLDLYCYSRFAKAPICTPEEELDEGKNLLDNFWTQIARRSPGCKRIEFGGNHLARIEKKLASAAPELLHLFDAKKIFSHKDVETYHDERAELKLSSHGLEMMCVHGWMSRGQNMAHANYFSKSVIHGHDHQLYCVSQNSDRGFRFEMSVGHLCDLSKAPFHYGPTKTVKWQHGCGLLDKHGPRAIPL